jgi:cellulose synthase operon protein C
MVTRFFYALCLVLHLTGCGTKPEAELEKARAAGQSKDYKSAVIHFKNVIQQSQDSAQIRLEYAQLLQESGDFTGVEQQLRRALELGADPNTTIPRIASWLLDRNEPKVLLKDFHNTQLKDEAAQNRLRGLRAIALLNTSKLEDVEKELSTITRPDSAGVLARAQAVAAKGDVNALQTVYKEARQLAEKSTLGSEEWWVWRSLARLSLALGLNDAALQDFQRANQLMPSHFGVLGEYGEALIGFNRVQDAQKVYADLLLNSPKYYRTTLLESLLSLNAGQTERAYDAALRVLATVPDNATSALIAARIEIQRNSFATAENRVTAILRANPNIIEALRLQALIAAKRGDFAQAEKLMRMTIQRSPNNINLKLEAADLALVKGNLKEAKALAEEILAKNPNSAKALGVLAATAAQTKDKIGSEKYLNLAVAALATEPSAADGLFRVAIRMRAFKQAQSIVEHNKKLDDTDPTPIFWQAIIAKDQGQEGDARKNLLASLDKKNDYIPALGLLKALQLDSRYLGEYGLRIKAAAQSNPKNEAIVLDYLTWLKQRKGSGEKVDTIMQESLSALKATPDSAALRKFTAELYLSDGKTADADKLIAEGLASFEKSLAVQELAAQWAERQGKFAEAANIYQKLAQLHPRSIAFALKHAQALSQNGQVIEAITAFERALGIHPEDETANRLLATARLNAGKKADAFRGLEEFSKLPGRLSDGLFLKAGAHVAIKEYGYAKKMINEALKIGAGERGIAALVSVLDAENKPQEADTVINQWLEKNPQSPNILMLAASRAAIQENYTKAIPIYNRLLQMRPGNAFLLNELAWAQASLNLPNAVKNARAALVLEPENPNVMDTVAFALSRPNGGQTDRQKAKNENQSNGTIEALDLWQKVVTLQPGIAEPSLNYSALLIELGKKEVAREVLAKINPKNLSLGQIERLKQLSAKAS